eukprot:1159213-Rhodomonas_salina.2
MQSSRPATRTATPAIATILSHKPTINTENRQPIAEHDPFAAATTPDTTIPTRHRPFPNAIQCWRRWSVERAWHTGPRRSGGAAGLKTVRPTAHACRAAADSAATAPTFLLASHPVHARPQSEKRLGQGVATTRGKSAVRPGAR